MTSDAICIIPARGGSKRLPRKNILPLNGEPMIGYPIQTAIKSGVFQQVIVSTEDDEIATIAEAAGARVMGRPKDLATDQSYVVQVCEHVLKVYQVERMANAHAFCCLYPTAVFVSVTQLRESRRFLEDADSVIGVTRYPVHPYKAMEETPDGLEVVFPKRRSMKSQEYPIMVAPNGTFYWSRIGHFLHAMSFETGTVLGYDIPGNMAIDIDTPEDYQRAQAIAAQVF